MQAGGLSVCQSVTGPEQRGGATTSAAAGVGHMGQPGTAWVSRPVPGAPTPLGRVGTDMSVHRSHAGQGGDSTPGKLSRKLHSGGLGRRRSGTSRTPRPSPRRLAQPRRRRAGRPDPEALRQWEEGRMRDIGQRLTDRHPALTLTMQQVSGTP
jgi:hypothetical protein